MSEIRNLTRNGETFYPLTHEKAVIGMEDFKDTITTQIDNYRPIEITGDVTNAPDEEDITSDVNNLLKFKNRNNLYGLGKIILRRGNSFSSQVTQANTIYIIQYNFDLDSARINIPNGSILLFEGGTLSNGTLVCADLFNVRLVYYQDQSEILSNVTLEGNFIFKACDKQSLVTGDNVSITESGGILSVKDGGITGNKLSQGIVNSDDLSLVNNKIQLSNRGTTNGMGYIILRKDLPFDSQLTQQNTIYVIRYNFILASDVTIPANCVLQFEGGSISASGNNDTITGNNTRFGGTMNNVFDGVSFAGTFICPVVDTDWFKDLSAVNDLKVIQPLINSSNEKTVYLRDKGYNYAFDISSNNTGLRLYSNTEIITNATFVVNTNSRNDYRLFWILNVENVSVVGGTYIGDKQTHGDSGGTSEYCHGILVYNSDNIKIENTNISYFPGDGISIGKYQDGNGCHNIYSINNDISYCGRQGITMTCVKNGVIYGGTISNISGTDPQYGIDLEPNNETYFIEDVKIQNVEFNTIRGIVMWQSDYDSVIKDIIIENCVFNCYHPLDFTRVNNIKVSNCWFNNNDDMVIAIWHTILITLCNNFYFENNIIKESLNSPEIGTSTLFIVDTTNAIIRNNNIRTDKKYIIRHDSGTILEDNILENYNTNSSELFHAEILMHPAIISNNTIKCTNLKIPKSSKISGNNIQSLEILFEDDVEWSCNTVTQCRLVQGKNNCIIKGSHFKSVNYYPTHDCLIKFSGTNNIISDCFIDSEMPGCAAPILTQTDNNTISNVTFKLTAAPRLNLVRSSYSTIGTLVIGIRHIGELPTNVTYVNTEMLVHGRYIPIAPTQGTTTERNNIDTRTIPSGFCFFDSSLSPARPIWYNGTGWVDATGTPV